MYVLRSLDGTALGIASSPGEAIRRYSYPGAMHIVTNDLGARSVFFGAGRYPYRAGLRAGDPVAVYNRDRYADKIEQLTRDYLAGRLPRV